MKKCFSLLLFSFLGITASFGQQEKATNPNPNIAAMDRSVIVGNFEVNKDNKEKGIIEHINVNYALSPAPFSKMVNIELNTPNPTLFAVYIVDANGKIVAKWAGAEKSHTYNAAINISSLVPGDYKANIFCGINSKVEYSIPFKKVNN